MLDASRLRKPRLRFGERIRLGVVDGAGRAESLSELVSLDEDVAWESVMGLVSFLKLESEVNYGWVNASFGPERVAGYEGHVSTGRSEIVVLP